MTYSTYCREIAKSTLHCDLAGNNDVIYGDYDLSMRLNVESGKGDPSGMPDYATGEIWVRI